MGSRNPALLVPDHPTASRHPAGAEAQLTLGVEGLCGAVCGGAGAQSLMVLPQKKKSLAYHTGIHRANHAHPAAPEGQDTFNTMENVFRRKPSPSPLYFFSFKLRTLSGRTCPLPFPQPTLSPRLVVTAVTQSNATRYGEQCGFEAPGNAGEGNGCEHPSICNPLLIAIQTQASGDFHGST